VLKLKYDELLSSFAFKFNLRRYNMVDAWLSAKMCVNKAFDAHGNWVSWDGGGTHRYLNCYHAAAGRCRLTQAKLSA